MTGRSNLFIKWLLPIVGAALAIVFLFWFYRDLDIDKFLAAVATANSVWLVTLAVTILLEQLVRGWKWRQILFDLKSVSSIRLFGAILAGYGVGALIPFGVSPLVRSWLIARLEGLRMACVLMTTAIERFLDGIVFALIAGLVALSGEIPQVQGGIRTGLAIAGLLNLVFFSALIWSLFLGRAPLGRDEARVSRWIDWVAVKGGRRLDGLRSAIREGIIWPRDRARQVGAIAASVVMKMISVTHFLWTGLAVGVVLAGWDYLFLMVFAGFALVLARFIRVPGGFVIGSAFALKLLDVPDEQALAMILFNNVFSIVLVVGIGLVFLWRSGIDIGAAQTSQVEIDGGG